MSGSGEREGGAASVAPLRTDPDRSYRHGTTGIYIRAKKGEEWGTYDIAELDGLSLLRFLTMRGPDRNEWAENTCLILLGHDPSSVRGDSE